MLERFFGLRGSDLAIDLGTANTLIGVAGEGVILDEPSVVAVEEGTTRVVAGGRAVGHLAKQMLGRTPGSISVVRPLSAGVITDFELCEAMLRYFFKKAQRGAGPRGPRVLVAVPGSITPVEKRAVYNSAHRAGARQVFLVSEAIAAAVGAGLPITEPVASMICDIGGGTTEVAVLSLGDVVASTSVRVGGDRMDQALQDYLRGGITCALAWPRPSNCALTLACPAARPRALDRGSRCRRHDRPAATIRLVERRIAAALAAPLDDILDAIKTTLDGCSPDLAADLVDHGITVCGGAVLLRQFDVLLAERIGLPCAFCRRPARSSPPRHADFARRPVAVAADAAIE